MFALETVLWFVEILLQPAFFTQCDFACLVLPLKFFLCSAGPSQEPSWRSVGMCSAVDLGLLVSAGVRASS